MLNLLRVPEGDEAGTRTVIGSPTFILASKEIGTGTITEIGCQGAEAVIFGARDKMMHHETLPCEHGANPIPMLKGKGHPIKHLFPTPNARSFLVMPKSAPSSSAEHETTHQ